MHDIYGLCVCGCCWLKLRCLISSVGNSTHELSIVPRADERAKRRRPFDTWIVNFYKRQCCQKERRLMADQTSSNQTNFLINLPVISMQSQVDCFTRTLPSCFALSASQSFVPFWFPLHFYISAFFPGCTKHPLPSSTQNQLWAALVDACLHMVHSTGDSLWAPLSPSPTSGMLSRLQTASPSGLVMLLFQVDGWNLG